MSLKKSATRRLSLLAGSSLMAAGLAAAAFTGAALAPSAAMAQATCVSVPLPAGNGTDDVVYAPGTYNPGIACVYTGTTAVVSTTGDTTVSTTAGGTGIDLSATGADSINWDSVVGRLVGGAQVNGPVIDATSAAGDINITHGVIIADGATTTHAIRATSTGGGDINIARLPSALGFVAVNATGPVGQVAVEAVTNGGDIAISNVNGVGAYNGRTYGILAQTSGAGSVSLNLGGTVQASQPTSIAAISATAGTGGVNINITTGAAQTFTSGAHAIIATTPGAVQVTNSSGLVIGAVNFAGVTGPGVTFDMQGATSSGGRWLIRGASVFSPGADTVTLGGAGDPAFGSQYDPGASIALGAGNDTFNISQLIPSTPPSHAITVDPFNVDFGAGDDTLNVTRLLAVNGTTLAFGAGNDTFNLSGTLSVDSGGLSISGLETFNSSGLIVLGVFKTLAQGTGFLVDRTRPDGEADDVLRLGGISFTGSGDSRLFVDALLGDNVQAGCETMTGAADCLDLRGGSTAGTTLLTVNYSGGAAEIGAFNPVGATVVDVGGGTSAAGHFVLDPNSSGYMVDPFLGPSLSRPGLFRYVLRYDADNQRHNLVSLPRREVLEYAILSGATQSIWHMTAETVTDRQMDLRSGADGGSVWVRAAGEYGKRSVSTVFETANETLTIDNGYKLYAGTIMGGIDLITGRSDGYDYVLGAQIGYVSSSFDMNESESSGRFSGATGGVYGSIWGNRLFLDGTFNLNGLTLDYDSPGLEGTKTNTYTNAVGARLDGGMRFMLTERTFIEPLASAAFVRTSFEEISLDGGTVRPANANSRRAALGVRLGADLTEGPINVGYFVSGRAWNEFDGTSDGAVANPGADLPFTDEFTGGFGEAEAGVNLYNEDGTLSGFLASGVKFKDGYSATNLSLGIRVRW